MIIFTAGDFGQAVADRISVLRSEFKVFPLTVVTDTDAFEKIIKDAAFVAVATWRPYLKELMLIDQYAFDHKFSWSLAEIHGQRLMCGPLVIPGAGACYSCFRQRLLTQHKSPDRERVLESYYRSSPQAGPFGHVNALVEIATQAILEDASLGADDAGRFRAIDVLSGAVLESRVIGVHECPRCRPKDYTEVGGRFTQHLIPEIERIMS